MNTDASKGPVVGHKTFRSPDGSYRHEPLHKSEADTIMAAVDAAKLRRAELMPTEKDAANAMWEAWYRLKELGWKETMYGPTNETVLVVEPGSSGIHKAERWAPWPEKTWWIDGDCPSTPVLWKPLPSTIPTPLPGHIRKTMPRLTMDQEKLAQRVNVFRDTIAESKLTGEDCPYLAIQITEQIVVLDLMRAALTKLRDSVHNRSA